MSQSPGEGLPHEPESLGPQTGTPDDGPGSETPEEVSTTAPTVETPRPEPGSDEDVDVVDEDVVDEDVADEAAGEEAAAEAGAAEPAGTDAGGQVDAVEEQVDPPAAAEDADPVPGEPVGPAVEDAPAEPPAPADDGAVPGRPAGRRDSMTVQFIPPVWPAPDEPKRAADPNATTREEPLPTLPAPASPAPAAQAPQDAAGADDPPAAASGDESGRTREDVRPKIQWDTAPRPVAPTAPTPPAAPAAPAAPVTPTTPTTGDLIDDWFSYEPERDSGRPTRGARHRRADAAPPPADQAADGLRAAEPGPEAVPERPSRPGRRRAPGSAGTAEPPAADQAPRAETGDANSTQPDAGLGQVARDVISGRQPDPQPPRGRRAAPPTADRPGTPADGPGNPWAESSRPGPPDPRPRPGQHSRDARPTHVNVRSGEWQRHTESAQPGRTESAQPGRRGIPADGGGFSRPGQDNGPRDARQPGYDMPQPGVNGGPDARGGGWQQPGTAPQLGSESAGQGWYGAERQGLEPVAGGYPRHVQYDGVQGDDPQRQEALAGDPERQQATRGVGLAAAQGSAPVRPPWEAGQPDDQGRQQYGGQRYGEPEYGPHESGPHESGEHESGEHRAEHDDAAGHRKPRRGRVAAITAGVLVALVAVLVGVQLVRPVPVAQVHLTVAAEHTFSGDAPTLTWPSNTGQAVLEVAGIGQMGATGSQTPTPTASVAKVMTAYLFLKDHPLAASQQGPTFTIGTAEANRLDWRKARDESLIDVKAGQPFTELQALEALLVVSANNIAHEMARWDAGGDAAFVAKMNATATSLGMTNTTYTDPSGFEASTVSTAADQVKLLQAALKEPAFVEAASTKVINVPNNPPRYATDLLIGQDGVIAGKTGFTSAAGGNFVFAARKVINGTEVTIVGAIMSQQNVPSSEKTVLSARPLLESAEQALESAPIAAEGTVVGSVTDGLGGSTPLVAGKDITAVGWPGLTVPLSIKGAVTAPRSAPSGAPITEISLGGGTDAPRAPVVLGRSLQPPSYLARLLRLG